MEETFGLLLGFLRVVIVELLLYRVFYWIGWPACKLLSFGKYPSTQPNSNTRNRKTLVFLVGIAVSLAIFMTYIYW